MARSFDRDDTPLLEQTEAIRGYLDELLRELPGADDNPVEIEVPEPAPVEPPPLPALRRGAPAEPAASAGTATIPAVPDWAIPEFQALLFTVGELSLAVPLVKLNSVIPWGAPVAKMPRQPVWAHGMMRYRERNVVVINTARLVLPAERAAADAEQGDPEHILIVGDGRWGLACRSIGEVMRLTSGEIRWRSSAGQRPWLAGTVLGRLCALMDTTAFADMLSNSAAHAAINAP